MFSQWLTLGLEEGAPRLLPVPGSALSCCSAESGWVWGSGAKGSVDVTGPVEKDRSQRVHELGGKTIASFFLASEIQHFLE